MNFSWGKKVEEGAAEEIQSIKIPNFSVSQCDSVSGAACSKRKSLRSLPSECLFCLHALIYISHCSWRGRAVAGKYLTLTARRFTFPKKKKRKEKKKRSQLSAADGFDFNGKKKKKKAVAPPKNNRQTLFCSALLSSLKCLIHVYTY